MNEKINLDKALQGVDVLYANAVDLITENTKYLPEYLKPIRDNIKHELKRLEEIDKLQEELGCPLEVRCEVVPNSYIYTFGTSMETQEVIIKRKVSTIDKEGIRISYATTNGREREMTLSWKAYKKAWFLKEDKSE